MKRKSVADGCTTPGTRPQRRGLAGAEVVRQRIRHEQAKTDWATETEAERASDP